MTGLADQDGTRTGRLQRPSYPVWMRWVALFGAIAAPLLAIGAAVNGRWLMTAVFAVAAVVNTRTFLRASAARP